MAGLRLLLFVWFLGLIGLSAAQSDQKSNSTEMMMEEDTSVERKKNDGMEQLYMMAMMIKGFVQTMMSVISSIVQIKSFGVSVISVIISLVRTVAMLKSMHQGGGGSGMSWDSNRRYATMAPHIHPAVHPAMHSYSAPYSSYFPTYGSDEKVV